MFRYCGAPAVAEFLSSDDALLRGEGCDCQIPNRSLLFAGITRSPFCFLGALPSSSHSDDDVLGVAPFSRTDRFLSWKGPELLLHRSLSTAVILISLPNFHYNRQATCSSAPLGCGKRNLVPDDESRIPGLQSQPKTAHDRLSLFSSNMLVGSSHCPRSYSVGIHLWRPSRRPKERRNSCSTSETYTDRKTQLYRCRRVCTGPNILHWHKRFDTNPKDFPRRAGSLFGYQCCLRV
jgi:hypothetical protein